MTNSENERHKKYKYKCPRPWTEIAIAPTGAITPCCVFEHPLKADNGEYLNIGKHGLDEIWNSRAYRELRMRMQNDEHIDACSQCYFQEKNNSTSKRQESLDIHDQLGLTVPYEQTNDDGSLDIKPISMDLKLGNKCNLACRMCQPKDSSFVADEFKELTKENKSFISFENANPYDPYFNKKFNDLAKWSDGKNFLEQFKELAPNIKWICIAGGEPLIQDEFFELVEALAEKSPNSRVYISTNLSVYPKKIKNIIEKFSYFHFAISVDSYGERFNYIRYPLRWKRFMENLNALASDLQSNSHVELSLCPTVQNYNVLYLDELIDFYINEFTKIFNKNFCNLYIHMLTHPEHLSINFLPDEIKAAAYNKLKRFKDTFNGKSRLAHNGVTRLLNILQSKDIKPSAEILKGFLTYTELIDKRRKQSFAESLPELYELLTKYLDQKEKSEIYLNNETLTSYVFSSIRDSKPHEALEVINGIIEKNQNLNDDQLSHLYYLISECNLELNLTQSALESLKISLEKGRSNLDSISLYATLMLEMENYDAALEYYEKYLTLAQELNIKIKDETLSGKVNCLAKLGRDNEAIEIVNRFIKQSAHSLEVLNLLGSIKLHNKEFEEALNLFEQYIDSANHQGIKVKESVFMGRLNCLIMLDKKEEAISVIEQYKEKTPKYLDSISLFATVYLKNQNYEKALEYYDRFIDRVQQEEEFIREDIIEGKAHCLIMLNRKDEAKAVLDTFKNKSLTSLDLISLYATVHLQNSDYENALRYYVQYIENATAEKHDIENEVIEGKIHCLIMLRQSEKAEAELNLIKENLPNSLDLISLFATICLEDQEYSKALKFYEDYEKLANVRNIVFQDEIIAGKINSLIMLKEEAKANSIVEDYKAKNPGALSTLGLLAMVNLQMEEFSTALDLYNQYIDRANKEGSIIDEKIYAGKISCLGMLKREEEALKVIDGLNTISPRTRFLNAKLFYSIKRLADAESIFKSLIEGEKIPPAIYSKSLLYLADIYYQMGDIEKASHYYILLSKTPNISQKDLINSANLLLTINKIDEAKEVLSKIIPNFNQSTSRENLMNLLPLIDYFNLYNDVKDILDFHWAKEEKSYQICYYKALKLYKQKSFTEAATEFKTALEFKPNDIQTLKLYGWSLKFSKNYKAANDTFNKVLNLAPEDNEAIDEIRRLNKGFLAKVKDKITHIILGN